MRALAPLSLACALALVACNKNAGDDTDASNTPPAESAAQTTTPEATPPGAMPADQAAPSGAMPADQATAGADQAMADGDGAALGLLATIDQHEIDAARQAKDKEVDGDVLAFADMMEKEHGANLEKTRALGPAADTPDIAAMKQKNKAELDALAAKSGDEYQKAYIDAMVKGHQDALDAIDRKMMPAATRDEVKQHLADSRKAVEAHLTRAKEIAGKM